MSTTTDLSAAETTNNLIPPEPFRGYVVAIGASAGGLDALERFFGELPANSGAAFVVIQHLSPDHKSMMSDLLSRYTAMTVVTAENNMPLQADHIFLIPPGQMMVVSEGRLQLTPKNPRGLNLPIDLFFHSAANDFGPRCIGVILSGTGSDGTRGAVSLNEAGGLILAQDTDSARFDGMPRSVIATGLVDAVLPPEGLAQRVLEQLKRQPIDRRTLIPFTEPGDDDAILAEILHLLQQHSGIQFKDYKSTTVMRRIERRCAVLNVADLSSYLRLLRNDRAEIEILAHELLIEVTWFFRDPEAFEELTSLVIKPLVRSVTDRRGLRVWVAGCSTGEEAYSLAMLFHETCDREHRWPNLKIFATDIEQAHIDVASTGVYTEAQVASLSPGRLQRFFDRKGNNYVVKSALRQNIIFARHDLLQNPPFTHIDLAACRNTLIYFNNDAQERALRRLQYSLTGGGFLFLGSSESLGNLQQDFNTLHPRYKIYQVIRPATVPFEMHPSPIHRRMPTPSRRSGPLASDTTLFEACQNLLLEQYAPPSLLLSDQRELIHVFRQADQFLRIPEGVANLEVLRLLPNWLVPMATALIYKAFKENTTLRSDWIQPPESERNRPGSSIHTPLRLVIRPLTGLQVQDRYLVLSFELPDTNQLIAPEQAPLVDIGTAAQERIAALERELTASRESLQATIEELETANEELQATNEELMAANEELQSTNEELQSVNEELYTLNSEYQEKIEIMARLNADLDHMTRATQIPTLFIDGQLCLTRFTPETMSVFRIRESDIGRPLSDFNHQMDYPELLNDLHRVIEKGETVSREVLLQDGRCMLARLFPYQVVAPNLRGAVLTLIDVTGIKDSQRLQDILDSLPEHVAVLDASGRITAVNRAWREFAQQNGSPSQLTGIDVGSDYLHVCQIQSGLDAKEATRLLDGLTRVLRGELPSFTHRYPCHSATEQRWFLMHIAPIRGASQGAVVTHVNITPWIEEESKQP